MKGALRKAVGMVLSSVHGFGADIQETIAALNVSESDLRHAVQKTKSSSKNKAPTGRGKYRASGSNGRRVNSKLKSRHCRKRNKRGIRKKAGVK